MTLFAKSLSESLKLFAFFGDISSSEIHLVLANLFLGSAALACFALGIVDWRKLL